MAPGAPATARAAAPAGLPPAGLPPAVPPPRAPRGAGDAALEGALPALEGAPPGEVLPANMPERERMIHQRSK